MLYTIEIEVGVRQTYSDEPAVEETVSFNIKAESKGHAIRILKDAIEDLIHDTTVGH